MAMQDESEFLIDETNAAFDDDDLHFQDLDDNDVGGNSGHEGSEDEELASPKVSPRSDGSDEIRETIEVSDLSSEPEIGGSENPDISRRGSRGGGNHRGASRLSVQASESKSKRLREHDGDLQAAPARKRGRRGPNPASQTPRALDAYRKLVNEMITAVQDPVDYIDQPFTKPLHTSTYGATVWNATEKNRFFRALARYGRHDVARIAEAVVTKSLPEIRQYLRLLDSHLVHEELKGRKDRLFEGPEGIPAAAEIGRVCENSIAALTDRIVQRQEAIEAKERQAEWGEWAVLDWTKSTQLLDSIANKHGHETWTDQKRAWEHAGAQSGKDNDNPSSLRLSFLAPVPKTADSIARLTPAVMLIDVPEMLDMSVRMFMNPSLGRNGQRREENWQTLSTNPAYKRTQTPPTIAATCILDVLNLLIIYTRRLVSTTMHTTMSRLRTSDTRGGRLRLPKVNREDVLAACDMLGTKTHKDYMEWWRLAARRNHWRVVETSIPRKHKIRNRSRRGVLTLRPTHVVKRLKYAEVERMLNLDTAEFEDDNGKKSFRDDGARKPSEEFYSFSEDEDETGFYSDTSSIDWSPETTPAPISNTENNGGTPSTYVNNTTMTEMPVLPQADDLKAETTETAYLNHIDAVSSRAEEENLCEILKLPRPASHAIKLEENAPEQPKRERKTMQDLKHWDDDLMPSEGRESGYISEWQQYCGNVPESAFETTMEEWKKARRVKRRKDRLREKRNAGRKVQHTPSSTDSARRSAAENGDVVMEDVEGNAEDNHSEAEGDDEDDDDAEGEDVDSISSDESSTSSEDADQDMTEAATRRGSPFSNEPALAPTPSSAPSGTRPARARPTDHSYNTAPTSAGDIALPHYLAQSLGGVGGVRTSRYGRNHDDVDDSGDEYVDVESE